MAIPPLKVTFLASQLLKRTRLLFDVVSRVSGTETRF